MAKSLNPQFFGIFLTFVIMISYGPILCLGAVETLLKEVPYLKGANQLQRVRSVESGVMGAIVLSAGIALLLGFVAPFVFPAALLGIPRNLIWAVATTIAASLFSGYFYHRSAAHEAFKLTGLIDFIRAVAAFVLVCGLSALWGLRGAVVGFLTHELVVLLVSGWLSFSRQGAVGVSIRAGLLIEIIKVGFPITIVWWVLILQNSVDRVVLGSLIGPTAVGHYGLGLSVAGLLAVVPMALARVLYPQVNRAFGKVTDVESMKRLLIAPTIVLGVMLANLQLLILALLPFLYNRVLPKYGPGLAAGQMLVIGTFFICLLRNGANYMIAINEQRAFLKYVLITLIVNLAADICLIKMGFGLRGVAVGTSLAGFILTTCVWRRVLHHLKFDRIESWSKLAVLYMPCLLVALGVALLRLATQRPFQSASLETVVLFGIVTVLFNATLCCLPPYRSEMLRFLRVLPMPHRKSDIPPSASALPSAG